MRSENARESQCGESNYSITLSEFGVVDHPRRLVLENSLSADRRKLIYVITVPDHSLGLRRWSRFKVSCKGTASAVPAFSTACNS